MKKTKITLKTIKALTAAIILLNATNIVTKQQTITHAMNEQEIKVNIPNQPSRLYTYYNERQHLSLAGVDIGKQNRKEILIINTLQKNSRNDYTLFLYAQRFGVLPQILDNDRDQAVLTQSLARDLAGIQDQNNDNPLLEQIKEENPWLFDNISKEGTDYEGLSQEVYDAIRKNLCKGDITQGNKIKEFKQAIENIQTYEDTQLVMQVLATIQQELNQLTTDLLFEKLEPNKERVTTQISARLTAIRDAFVILHAKANKQKKEQDNAQEPIANKKNEEPVIDEEHKEKEEQGKNKEEGNGEEPPVKEENKDDDKQGEKPANKEDKEGKKDEEPKEGQDDNKENPSNPSEQDTDDLLTKFQKMFIVSKETNADISKTKPANLRQMQEQIGKIQETLGEYAALSAQQQKATEDLTKKAEGIDKLFTLTTQQSEKANKIEEALKEMDTQLALNSKQTTDLTGSTKLIDAINKKIALSNNLNTTIIERLQQKADYQRQLTNQLIVTLIAINDTIDEFGIKMEEKTKKGIFAGIADIKTKGKTIKDQEQNYKDAVETLQKQIAELAPLKSDKSQNTKSPIDNGKKKSQ